MWVATPTRKRLVGAFAALVGASLVAGGAYFLGKKQGIQEGIDMYHQMCYDIGGITVDSEGRAVLCAKIGQLSKKELDREIKARYNE